jgi:hypothetical protein
MLGLKRVILMGLLLLVVSSSGCVVYCPDGTRVSDPNLCPKEFICPTGESVLDPSLCPKETVPPSTTTTSPSTTTSTSTTTIIT